MSTACNPIVIESSWRKRTTEKSSLQREAFRAVLQRTIVAIPQIKTRGDYFSQGTVADLKEVQLQIEASQVLAGNNPQTKEQQNIDSSF